MSFSIVSIWRRVRKIGHSVFLISFLVVLTIGPAEAQDTSATDSNRAESERGRRTVQVPTRLLNDARRAAGAPLLRRKSVGDSLTLHYQVSPEPATGLFEWLEKEESHSEEGPQRTLPEDPPVEQTTLPGFRPDTSQSKKSTPQKSSDARFLLEGITFGAFDLFGTAQSIPADTHGAVGLNHVCHIANVSIQCHTKDGESTFKISLYDFFDQGDKLFDPKILYDSRLDRYVLVVLNVLDNGTASENKSEVYLAASDDSNPSGTWNFQVFDVSAMISVNGQLTECWFDYPGYAVGEEAIYVTGNYFSFESEDQSVKCDSRLAIFDKNLLLGGGSSLNYLDDPNKNWEGGDFDGTLQPAYVPEGGNPGSETGTWIGHYNGLFSDFQDESEYWLLTRVEDPLSSPSFESSLVFLGDYDDTSASEGFGVPDAPQPESDVPIETNDRRLLDLVWRNGFLWGTTTVVPPPDNPNSGETTAAFAKVDVTEPGSPVATLAGYLGGEDIALGAYTYFPSVAVDENGNAAFGFSLSSPSVHPNSYLVTLPSGSLSPTYLAARDPYRDPYVRPDESNENRWGDYSDVEIDPVDGSVWTMNQVAADRVTACLSECGAWKVYVANFSSSKLPVELAQFDARIDKEEVILTWQTASETNNSGFRVQRRPTGRDAWTNVGFVEGRGTTDRAQSYRFTDADLPYGADSLSYRLKQVDADGSTSISGRLTVRRSGPSESELLGTIPNPARQQATVRFTVADRGEVTLRLYDVLGRQVETLRQAQMEAGRKQIQLDVSDLSSGTYYLRLRSGNTTRTEKLSVVR